MLTFLKLWLKDPLTYVIFLAGIGLALHNPGYVGYISVVTLGVSLFGTLLNYLY
jgi:hypothetical protein